MPTKNLVEKQKNEIDAEERARARGDLRHGILVISIVVAWWAGMFYIFNHAG